MNVQPDLDTWVKGRHELPANRFGRVWRLVLRQRSRIVACAALVVLAFAPLVFLRTPTYTAMAQLLVENTRLESARQELLPATAIVDTSMVDTQLELIKSEAIALRVIEERHMADGEPPAPGFVASLKASIADLFPQVHSVDQPNRERAVLREFLANLVVRRVKLSSVIEVGFKAAEPERAAELTNAVIAAYLKEQAAANVVAASSASAWLRDKIKDLGPKIRVISLAGPPTSPDGPGKAVLLAGLAFFGLVSGLGLAVLRACRTDTLLEPQDVTSSFDLHYLGAFPAVSRFPRLFSLFRRAPRGVTLPPADCDYVFRVLTVGPKARRNPWVLGVVGVLPNAGVSSVACGLAAAADRRGVSAIVLTDAQLRTEPHAGADHELVLVELPSLLLVPSAITDGLAIDKLLLVVDWNRVPAVLLEQAIATADLPALAFAGFVFNRVPKSWVSKSSFPIESYRWTQKVRRA